MRAFSPSESLTLSRLRSSLPARPSLRLCSAAVIVAHAVAPLGITTTSLYQNILDHFEADFLADLGVRRRQVFAEHQFDRRPIFEDELFCWASRNSGLRIVFRSRSSAGGTTAAGTAAAGAGCVLSSFAGATDGAAAGFVRLTVSGLPAGRQAFPLMSDSFGPIKLSEDDRSRHSTIIGCGS